jgi:4-diphosphocytidyl-2-C-methyl-D-erythritol kinase
MRLRALAPAKVNLCLYLGPVREDGRHELVTVFESISLADELRLEVLADGGDVVRCPGVSGPNLVGGALAALRARGWAGPPLAIDVEKRIPVAAGLGGGSGDAAAALRLAHAVAPVGEEVMREVAATLGADVPSQLEPGVSIGRGAGELVEPVAPIPPHALLVLPQPFGLSTAEVYSEADRRRLPRSPGQLAAADRDVVAVLGLSVGAQLPNSMFVNDLEPAALALHPSIEQALDDARYAGATRAWVSGSGPTVVGLFWGEGAAAKAKAGAVALAGRYSGASAAVPVDASFGAVAPA